MESMSDAEYFNYLEPLSPEGARRVRELIEDLTEAEDSVLSLEDTIETWEECSAKLGELTIKLLKDYGSAMTGEALSESWEQDLVAAKAALAKIEALAGF